MTRGRDIVSGSAYDLEIKFKLLIVFNTLLCPAKHELYALGFHFTLRAYNSRGQNVAFY